MYCPFVISIRAVSIGRFQSLLVTWRTNRLTFSKYTLCPRCIYVFFIYLRTNSDLCHLQHKLIGFYKRDEKCLQRGTDWVFKYSGLRFGFKGVKPSVMIFRITPNRKSETRHQTPANSRQTAKRLTNIKAFAFMRGSIWKKKKTSLKR